MKISTITFYNPHTEEVVGEWRRTGEKITADLAVQDILTSSLARSSVEETWARYASWSNGYLSSAEGSLSEAASTS